jgi:hypothetical protein
VSQINGNSYPMYSGYLSASMLRKIASVPSFARDKRHHNIAEDLSRPPIDEWQRPLDNKKMLAIKNTYSRRDHNNLMANPVLLGMASTNISDMAYITIRQKQITMPNGEYITIENLFSINITYSETKKPLWILDGQHRIEGIAESIQRDQPMPFVLLYGEDVYEPKDLAEIFTQVTAGATPMEDLHSDWMKYAFNLEKYETHIHKKALQSVIYLCKESSFDGVINPFLDKIQFNPYSSKPSYYAFDLDMKEWEQIIAEEYFMTGTFSPKQLAGQIVKAVKAFEDLDTYKLNGSKIFTSTSPFRSLAEGFLYGLLRYLSLNNVEKSFVEWKNFFLDPLRAFNRCNWTMSFVRSTGALSSSYTSPSKKIARDCFDAVFNSPNELNGAILTDFLQGVQAYIKVTAYKKTPSGKKSQRDKYEVIIPPGSALVPFNLSYNGIHREIIDIETVSVNTYIFDVMDPNHLVHKRLSTKNLDISSFPNEYQINIHTMHYSGDTVKVTPLRLDK